MSTIDPRGAVVALHVACAIAALIVGPFLFARRKGDRRHRRFGTAYALLMLTACASAVVLLVWRFNPFLAGVTVLSAYTVLTAVRAIRWRSVGRPVRLDAALAGVGLAAGAAMAVAGVAIAVGAWPGGPTAAGDRIAVAGLALGFGGFVVAMAREDLGRWRMRDVPPLAWLDVLMARVVGSYIALSTAFAVQIAGYALPDGVQWVAWVAPGIVGGIVLAPRFVRRERARWLDRRSAAPSG